MKIAVIGNFSDRRCGFANFSEQTVIALARAGHDVTRYDGTYSLVYARREAGLESFLPPDPLSFDVIHLVWHPATLNHYAGAPWPEIRSHSVRPILSQWNGCPAAWCPFAEHMDVKWGVLGREEGHKQCWYPIPDWVENLPAPDSTFTVGYSGVRMQGVGYLTELCEKYGWAMNFSHPDRWLPLDEEVRRLARSTVNVGWYGGDDDRSGSAMMCLASHRPFLCNDVPMFYHVKPYADGMSGVICALNDPAALEQELRGLAQDTETFGTFPPPITSPILQEMSWTAAVRVLEEGWQR